MLPQIKSLYELLEAFPTEESCIEYLEEKIWKGNVVSPFDANSSVCKCGNGKYKCKKTNQYFTVKHFTIFAGSKIRLKKWFFAMWLVTSEKKGLTSVRLADHITVTQKTAWFMLQRIRSAYKVENSNNLEGTIEIDETLIGGKNKNRHVRKRMTAEDVGYHRDKTYVLGMRQRKGKMNAFMIPDRKPRTLLGLINKYAVVGSRIITDEWRSYSRLRDNYEYHSIKHKAYEYVKLDNPDINNNSIEGAWNHLKASVHRMYNHVSDKHLQLYLDEFCFRFNLRDKPDSFKFEWLVMNCGGRLKYRDLVGKKLPF